MPAERAAAVSTDDATEPKEYTQTNIAITSGISLDETLPPYDLTPDDEIADIAPVPTNNEGNILSYMQTPTIEQTVTNLGRMNDKKQRSTRCCLCCRRTSADELTINDENQSEDRNGANFTFILDTADNDVIKKSPPVAEPIQRSATLQINQTDTNQTCQKRCAKFCKKFMTILFSNIGLCAAVVAWSVLGGFIFQNLEAPNEIQKRYFIANRRAWYAQALWNLTTSLDIFDEDNYTLSASKILVDFQNEVLLAKKDGWDGSDGHVEPLWSFAGSLLYSVTVITTIGYGHIAPKTFEGRLVTMFYAMIGIPMTLLCLSNMGEILSDCFRLLYKHLCQLLTWMCCPPEESFTKRRSMTPSKMAQSRSGSTVQTLELQPLKVRPDEGDSNTLKVAQPIQPMTRKHRRQKSKSRSRSSSPTGSEAKSEINIVVEDYDREQETGTIKTEQIRVPIFVSLLIIAIYIFSGAIMFSLWENWDYLEGSYFCFITLSTIGFGDYVPGSISRTDSADSRNKLIMCCVYLLFGLSVIAMCFNLMQEDVRAKFRWLGVKIGLLDHV
ncbi:hypothetical protein DPMN_006861 [Dreissena polymorpha]|uniref:Potassium channel domain-containing protein n=3 Tax=Dreissena polymorpha TaxID=45954 RepID=A0A9D4RXS4_DREPO|nr:hypothetical protein DPMN_006861 [Dreissena polymorpha]